MGRSGVGESYLDFGAESGILDAKKASEAADSVPRLQLAPQLPRLSRLLLS